MILNFAEFVFIFENIVLKKRLWKFFYVIFLFLFLFLRILFQLL